MPVADRLVNLHRITRMIIVLIGISIAAGKLSAQAPTQSPPLESIQAFQQSHCSQSPRQTVTQPEALSGLWEAPNGNGGAVGIHLILKTTAPGDAKTLRGTPQSWQELEVGVYERKGATIQFGEENFFSDTPRCDIVSFNNGRLTLHWPSFDLDLVQISGDQWAGRMHRKRFDSTVTLRRAGISDPAKTNPIVGTWLYKSIAPSDISCIHIAQQTESEFTAWADALRVPGHRVRFDDLPSLELVYESYGEPMKIRIDGGGKVTLELHGTFSVVHTFIGKITQDGNLIQGEWLTGPNQTGHSGTWTKVSGDSCVNSAPSPAP